MKATQTLAPSVLQSRWAAYSLAVGLALLTLLVRVSIGDRLDGPTMIVFMVPIILSAYWGGFGPGLLATVISALGAAYFILAPIHNFNVFSTTHRVQELVLLLTGALISVICERFHREQDRVENLLAARKDDEKEKAQLAAIVESSDDAIIGKNLDGVVTSWNAGAEKIFGYTAQEMIGQPILRLIPLERQHEEKEILSAVRRGESVRHFDTVRVRKDGSSVDVSVTTSAIKDAAGKIIGASKVARDITERKQADEARRTSDARLNFALEASHVGAWELLLQDNTAHRTLIHAQIFGYETLLPAWTYEIFLEHVLTEDRARVNQSVREAIVGQSSLNLECRIRRVDNEVRWIWLAGGHELNAEGKAVRMSGIVQDITERKQVEKARRESEERFLTMANSMSQLAWIARADGFIIWYNVRWYEYTGTTPKEMEGWGWQSVHDPKVLPSVMENWKIAIERGEPFEMEFPLRGADGQFRSFLTRSQPLRDSDGNVVQWFGTNTDVETLKQAEAAVQRLNEELEQRVTERTAQLETANKELEAFSYSVSHDLRAPLRAVNGFAKIVLERFADKIPVDAQGYLSRIRNGGMQMGMLIDDLLAFSRLSRQAMKADAVNMKALVENILVELSSHHAGRPVEIKVEVLPAALGDASLIKQVWVNLISNAIKYSRGRTPAVIEIGCETGTGENIYFVRDNGTGFDMRYVDKLFGVFQRLHRAEEFEGTGVGLAIVQRIVQRHGGRVWAESVEGKGATFRFTLNEEKNHEHN